jgi:hypothetical protein
METGALVVLAIELLPGAVPLGLARAVLAKLTAPSRNLRLHPEQSFLARTASPDPERSECILGTGKPRQPSFSF